jgi:hypothetical protein
MPTFFKKYSNLILSLLTVLFLAAIMAFAAYAGNALANEVQGAFGPPAVTYHPASFNLQGATALDLRGLMQR